MTQTQPTNETGSKTMSAKMIDIAFLVGSGRVNWDVEQRLFGLLGADGMRDWNRKMKTATAEQINQTWEIVKATPAGSSLA